MQFYPMVRTSLGPEGNSIRVDSNRDSNSRKGGLTSFLPKNKDIPDIPRDNDKGFPLLQIEEYSFNFNDLILPKETKHRLEYIVSENRASDTLRSYGLRPKQKLLFYGPPGTGKTFSSKILSSVLGYSHIYVRFDSILSSYLGETATNLRRIFDFIERGQWVVLFDEFDIIGKKRDDPHEHGEIKRVVNNFIQMIDNYRGPSILVAATNHQHLIDSGVWRRFDEILYFPLPDKDSRIQLFKKYLGALKKSNKINLSEYAQKTQRFSAADIAQVCEDALRRTLVSGNEEVNSEHIRWAIREQTRRKRILIDKR